MPYHQLIKVGKRSKKKTYFEIGEDFSYGLVRLRCEGGVTHHYVKDAILKIGGKHPAMLIVEQ